MTKLNASLDYIPSRYNWYWLGARRVEGSGNPGIWQWMDGSDVIIE